MDFSSISTDFLAKRTLSYDKCHTPVIYNNPIKFPCPKRTKLSTLKLFKLSDLQKFKNHWIKKQQILPANNIVLIYLLLFYFTAMYNDLRNFSFKDWPCSKKIKNFINAPVKDGIKYDWSVDDRKAATTKIKQAKFNNISS